MSDQNPMIEQLEQSKSGVEEPLGRKPKEFLVRISQIERDLLGVSPVEGDWSGTNEDTVHLFEERILKVCAANHLIAESLEGVPDLGVTAQILDEITPELMKISYSQLKDGFDQMEAQKKNGSVGVFTLNPKSWREIDKLEAQSLDIKLGFILGDSRFESFFDNNPSFKHGLEFMKQLIDEKDPEVLYQKGSEYMHECVQANKEGKIVLYMPVNSDTLDPAADEKQLPKVCEPYVSLIIPLDKADREEFFAVSKGTWDINKAIRHAHEVNNDLNIVAGYDAMGAGYSRGLSAVAGESFTIKTIKGHEHGYALFVNNLDKKYNFWKATNKLGTEGALLDKRIFRKILTLLTAGHESAHRIFPNYGTLGEISADIPAVITGLKVAFSPELLGNGFDESVYNPENLIRGILTEYVGEIIKNVSDEDLIEGHSSNLDNPLYKGYLLSAVFIVNALCESKVAEVLDGGRIKINTSPEQISEFIKNLTEVNDLFHQGNPRVLGKIQLAVANSDAIKLIKLYREEVSKMESAEQDLEMAENRLHQ